MMGCICVPVKMRGKSGKLGRTCQGLSNLHDLVGTGTFEIHQSCWYYRERELDPLSYCDSSFELWQYFTGTADFQYTKAVDTTKEILFAC